MAHRSGSPQARSNHSYYLDAVQNSYVPSAQSTNADRYLAGLKTTRTPLPPWIPNLPWYEEMSPGDVDSPLGFRFEDEDEGANIPHEGDGHEGDPLFPLFSNSVATNYLSNTVTNIVPPIDAVLGPNQSAAPTTPLQSQALPTPPGNKYQCTGCLKTFDRESRLENCLNRHFGVKPHRCFGVCGSIGCPASYASAEQLNRHVDRLVLCSSWWVPQFKWSWAEKSPSGKARSKQNMARHRASCGGSQSRKTQR